MKPAWMLMLAACAADPAMTEQAPPPPPEQGPGQATDGKPRSSDCGWVVSSEGANALFAAGKSLQDVDPDCTFEDVHVRGSTVELAFETPDGSKVPATLRILACLPDSAPAGAHVADPWVLELPAASLSRCPRGFASLKQALSAGSFPRPTEAR